MNDAKKATLALGGRSEGPCTEGGLLSGSVKQSVSLSVLHWKESADWEEWSIASDQSTGLG